MQYICACINEKKKDWQNALFELTYFEFNSYNKIGVFIKYTCILNI